MGQDTEELKRDIENTRADMSGTLDAIGDRVSPGRIAERNKNKVVGKMTSLRDKVMGTASSAQHRLADTSEHASDTAKHAPDAIVEHTQGAPMVAGAIAFGVGFLVAAALPVSDKEKQLSSKVLESAEPIKAQLVDSAHEIADHLNQPVKDAAQNVKDAATAGAQTVAATAKDAVGEAHQQASEAVEAVKAGDSST